MPELPDVEVWRRYARGRALHQTITRVELGAPEMLLETSPRRLRQGLVGRRFLGTGRHGKYLFLRLTGRAWLALHFGMTGGLAYGRAARSVPPHTRLLIRFAQGFHLACDSQRKLGKIALIVDPDAFVHRRRLGMDALDPRLTEAHLRLVLARKRASVKAALLDQHVIAGIGNLYADEILFQAHIDPRSPAGSLGSTRAHALLTAMRRVLRLAIARRVDLQRFPRTWLLPHRSPSGRCPRCRRRFKCLHLAGRTCYVCVSCQVGRGDS